MPAHDALGVRNPPPFEAVSFLLHRRSGGGITFCALPALALVILALNTGSRKGGTQEILFEQWEDLTRMLLKRESGLAMMLIGKKEELAIMLLDLEEEHAIVLLERFER